MRKVSVQDVISQVDPETLQSGSIFGALSAEATRFLLEEGNLFQVNSGDILFEPGDPGGSFFVVCQGSVEFYKHHRGKYRYTRTSEFGEEMGFVAMIGLHDHTGKAIVKKEGMVLEISSVLFSKLHDQFPYDFGVLMFNLARDMARVIRKLSNFLVEHAIEH
jgi:signal-transduction protein with cAMP-binding, CBS, and nucleotidyltransferase domain